MYVYVYVYVYVSVSVYVYVYVYVYTDIIYVFSINPLDPLFGDSRGFFTEEGIQMMPEISPVRVMWKTWSSERFKNDAWKMVFASTWPHEHLRIP